MCSCVCVNVCVGSTSGSRLNPAPTSFLSLATARTGNTHCVLLKRRPQAQPNCAGVCVWALVCIKQLFWRGMLQLNKREHLTAVQVPPTVLGAVQVGGRLFVSCVFLRMRECLSVSHHMWRDLAVVTSRSCQ